MEISPTNSLPQVDPTSPSVVVPEAVMTAVHQDIEIGKQLIAASQKKQYGTIVSLLLKNKPFIEDEVKQVEQLAPIIASGWKEPAFWLIVVYGAFNAFCLYKGIPLPTGDDAAMGGLVAAFLAHRHQVTK